MPSQDRILLHICCAPCATYSIERVLKDGYQVIGYFYNPNIQPLNEYKRRLKEVKKLAKIMELTIYFGNYNLKEWFRRIKGLEKEPEGGKRCEQCFKMRLEQTAIFAIEKNIKFFTTTLTISPHKNSELIHRIGREIGDKYGLEFLPYNFKKKDGFKKSIILSKKFNLYRQNYCGCIFSKNQSMKIQT
jgi:predicted adenine nucleotide alpha hydrolase (AANH) superfamily ATPase